MQNNSPREQFTPGHFTVSEEVATKFKAIQCTENSPQDSESSPQKFQQKQIAVKIFYYKIVHRRIIQYSNSSIQMIFNKTDY
jgi:hypothetical protein